MWRIVDISEPDRHLSLSHESLVVSAQGKELGRIPIRDIQAVIVHGHGSSLTLNAASALAEAGVPLVLSDRGHHPAALCLPVAGNFELARRIAAQASITPARQGRIWRDIVRRKILLQAEALERTGSEDAASIRKLASIVKPDDPENIEARAARYYWQRLLGPQFRRDTDGGALNGALNYGYAVLRATVARAVVATGLSPSLGVHHRNRLNAFQLVDDLMEPLRAAVDFCVWDHRKEFEPGLTGNGKAKLAALVNLPLAGVDGHSPLSRIAGQMASSLAEVYLGERKSVWLPETLLSPEQATLDWDGQM